MNLEIVRADDAAAPACLALLPEVNGAQTELLIAKREGALVGAAALVWANVFEPAGFNIVVKVLTSERRQGVGRALISAAADLADGETDGLWSLDGAFPDSVAAKFLLGCGFKPRKHEYHFQVGVEALLADIGPIAARFRARGHIPATAEILPLSEADAPIEEIAWLVAREFDGRPLYNIHSLLRRRQDNADRSLFARLDGELIGVLLWRVVDDLAIVDLRIAKKGERGGWANLAMLEKALRRGQAESLRQIQFFCDESINDTIKLARRGAGENVGVKARYYLDFGSLAG